MCIIFKYVYIPGSPDVDGQFDYFPFLASCHETCFAITAALMCVVLVL